jgi:hypothetical protein
MFFLDAFLLHLLPCMWLAGEPAQAAVQGPQGQPPPGAKLTKLLQTKPALLLSTLHHPLGR